MKESQKSQKYGFQHVVDIETFNVFSIPSGKYPLQLTVLDAHAMEIPSSSKAFFVYNPHLESGKTPLTLICEKVLMSSRTQIYGTTKFFHNLILRKSG